jgi:glutathione reductase (NADPH)
MSEYDYDLFVIGAGSGGVRAARMSSQYGARVAVAEEYRTGGTCVIRGCIPKKLFVYASQFPDSFKLSDGFGWTVDTSFNWNKLIENKDVEIARLSAIYDTNLKKAGVEIIPARAELRDAHTIELITDAGKRTVTADKILIATGGWPFVPDIPGADLTITSNEAFHLEDLPEKIAVVGGGFIALEFACIFKGLGVETTLIYRGPQVLRGFDRELSGFLQDQIAAKGVDVRLNSDVEKIEAEDGKRKVTLKDGTVLSVDQVMYATGRKPKVDGLGLEHAGVELDGGGAIGVNEYSQTNISNIYAVGDVTGRVALTPVAIREGAAFAETLFNDTPTTVDYSLIPSAVFTTPELGTVGLTQEQAEEKYGEVDVYKSVFRPMKYTLTDIQDKVMMKLLVHPETDKVLGCHIVGDAAAEMTQLASIALNCGATKAQFDQTVALHPSSAEEFVLMREKANS